MNLLQLCIYCGIALCVMCPVNAIKHASEGSPWHATFWAFATVFYAFYTRQRIKEQQTKGTK